MLCILLSQVEATIQIECSKLLNALQSKDHVIVIGALNLWNVLLRTNFGKGIINFIKNSMSQQKEKTFDIGDLPVNLEDLRRLLILLQHCICKVAFYVCSLYVPCIQM